MEGYDGMWSGRKEEKGCGSYHYLRFSKLVQLVRKSMWWVPAGESTEEVRRAAGGFAKTEDIVVAGELVAQRALHAPGMTRQIASI